MSNRLRSDATQPIAEAIQDTMMRKWTPLDEAAAYVLDALLTYLEAHTDERDRIQDVIHELREES